MAKAGNSWRSNGKSRRKRVLKRAVMVSEEKQDCSSTESHFQTLMLNKHKYTFLLVPHSQHSEYEGTEGGSKEAPPVVPHSKKRGSDLNTKQNPCSPPPHTPTHTRWENACCSLSKCQIFAKFVPTAPISTDPAPVLVYLQLGQRSSSPRPLHRRPTASPCSAARSVQQESHKCTRRRKTTHPRNYRHTQKLNRSAVHVHKFTHDVWGMNSRYGKPWLEKPRTGCWNRGMRCLYRSKGSADRCVSWCRFAGQGQTEWKGQSMAASKVHSMEF